MRGQRYCNTSFCVLEEDMTANECWRTPEGGRNSPHPSGGCKTSFWVTPLYWPFLQVSGLLGKELAVRYAPLWGKVRFAPPLWRSLGMLVIWIMAIPLASDSAITIAQFRPSKCHRRWAFSVCPDPLDVQVGSPGSAVEQWQRRTIAVLLAFFRAPKKGFSFLGALRRGPPFHGSRS